MAARPEATPQGRGPRGTAPGPRPSAHLPASPRAPAPAPARGPRPSRGREAAARRADGPRVVRSLRPSPRGRQPGQSLLTGAGTWRLCTAGRHQTHAHPARRGAGRREGQGAGRGWGPRSDPSSRRLTTRAPIASSPSSSPFSCLFLVFPFCLSFLFFLCLPSDQASPPRSLPSSRPMGVLALTILPLGVHTSLTTVNTLYHLTTCQIPYQTGTSLGSLDLVLDPQLLEQRRAHSRRSAGISFPFRDAFLLSFPFLLSSFRTRFFSLSCHLPYVSFQFTHFPKDVLKSIASGILAPYRTKDMKLHPDLILPFFCYKR